MWTTPAGPTTPGGSLCSRASAQRTRQAKADQERRAISCESLQGMTSCEPVASARVRRTTGRALLPGKEIGEERQGRAASTHRQNDVGRWHIHEELFRRRRRTRGRPKRPQKPGGRNYCLLALLRSRASRQPYCKNPHMLIDKTVPPSLAGGGLARGDS